MDHRVLLDILRRKFPNEDGYLWLMETIINCDHTPFGLPPGKSADEIPPSERLFEVGMPIGNLTSQLLANVCLNELDQSYQARTESPVFTTDTWTTWHCSILTRPH